MKGIQDGSAVGARLVGAESCDFHACRHSSLVPPPPYVLKTKGQKMLQVLSRRNHLPFLTSVGHLATQLPDTTRSTESEGSGS